MDKPSASGLTASALPSGPAVNASLAMLPLERDGTLGLEAIAWERFLAGHPLAQYQQSVRWARVKEGEGWRAWLHTWGAGADLAGGFQLLVKTTRLGRIGFINKGPVLAEETPGGIDQALARVVRAVRSLGLRALILQPADRSRIRSEDLVRHGFCRAPVPGIIDATLIASLEGEAEAIRGRVGRSARREARRAVEKGVQVVEGARADLPRFFELMCHTCRRQGVAPNPSSVDSLYRRWDAFAPDIRVLFAKVRGELVAGLLLLRFGKCCTFEKKGWNEKFPEAHPNTLLNVEAMIRAAEWGCTCVDFGAMDRALAERMLKGEEVEAELSRTRYAFNVRLGAQPVLLTPAQIYLPNRWQRCLVDWLLGRKRLARQLERWISG